MKKICYILFILSCMLLNSCKGGFPIGNYIFLNGKFYSRNSGEFWEERIMTPGEDSSHIYIYNQKDIQLYVSKPISERNKVVFAYFNFYAKRPITRRNYIAYIDKYVNDSLDIYEFINSFPNLNEIMFNNSIKFYNVKNNNIENNNIRSLIVKDHRINVINITIFKNVEKILLYDNIKSGDAYAKILKEFPKFK